MRGCYFFHNSLGNADKSTRNFDVFSVIGNFLFKTMYNLFKYITICVIYSIVNWLYESFNLTYVVHLYYLVSFCSD